MIVKKRKIDSEGDINDTKKQEGYKFEFEGLSDKSIFYCDRIEKILDLKKKLDEENIIYMRSPTATGKTSLVHLIKRSKEYKDKYDIIVFPSMVSAQDSLEIFKKRTGFNNFEDAFQEYKGDKHLLYIIDDAQNIFKDDRSENNIIDGIKPLKNAMDDFPLEERKVHVLILATHGEKTLGKIYSQITLPNEQILGIEYLLFSKNEYDMAMQNLKERNGPDLTGLPLSFFKLTNGHPGLLSQTISLIHSRFRPNWQETEKDKLVNYCLSNDFLEKLTVYKLFHDVLNDSPNDKEFNENRKDAVVAIQKLLDSPTQFLEIDSNDELISVKKATSNFLRKLGVCKYEEGGETHISWSFDYLRIFYMRKITKKIPKEYKDIHNFTKDFLELLPYNILKERLDPKLYGEIVEQKRKKEIYYQNIFFMLAMKLLGKSVHPEVGTKAKKSIDDAQPLIKTCNLLEEIKLKKDKKFSFMVDANTSGDDSEVAVTNKDLINLTKKGDTLSVGGLSFSVDSTTGSAVYTTVKKGGCLKNNQKILIKKKAEFINFYVNSLKFGFEFMIDGNTTRNVHYERFRLNGDYSFLELKNFQLIDFTIIEPPSNAKEIFKGMTFVYFRDDFKKATINYFRRNEVTMDLLRNKNKIEKPRKDLNDECDEDTYFNLRNGSYDDEYTIDLDVNQSLSKALTLELRQIIELKGKKYEVTEDTKYIEKVPVLLETFKKRIRELFNQYLGNKEFIIRYKGSQIENEKTLFDIPENSTIGIFLNP